MENSLGLVMIPIAQGVSLAATETRVKDYRVFAEETGAAWVKPWFEQGEDHPVVCVSWGDAMRFCAWLTARDQELGLIDTGSRYRLPRESEWMAAANPDYAARSGSLSESGLLFAWGDAWPPPAEAGNWAEVLGVDDYPQTSPVGSFPKNAQGFYDLSGNAWEWCLDTFEDSYDIFVLKGGSWRMSERSKLALNTKVGNVSTLRLPGYGFRIALEWGGQ